jgi:membrane-associated protease RseP (regulator of RpoE activity)
MLRRSQPQLIAWLIVGGVVACTWCSLLSGGVGWLLGQDLGWRQGRAETRADMLPAAGVLVTRVDRDGPAYLAGIEAADVILAVNGERVADVPALRDALASFSPGDAVQLTVRRDGDERRVAVRLARLPGGSEAYLGIYYTARADEPGDV